MPLARFHAEIAAGKYGNVDRFVGNVRRFRNEQPLIGLIDKQLGY